MSRWKNALFALIGVFVLGDASAEEAGVAKFYEFDLAQIAGNPGEVVASQALKPMRKGEGYRVLYRTLGTDKRPTIASTLIFYPKKAVAGNRKIVVWAHPTTGIKPRCAPSRLPEAPYDFMSVPGLEEFLEDGLVVVAPDYVGLGATPKGEQATTIHPYLDDEVAAYSIRDAARASRLLAVELTKQGLLNEVVVGSDVALFGHSQGGQAALAAASLLSGQNNELKVRTLAVSAPPARLDKLLPLQRSMIGQVLTAYLTKSLEADDPALRVEDFLAPSLIAVRDQLIDKCSGIGIEQKEQVAILKGAGLGVDPEQDTNGTHLTRIDLPTEWLSALRSREPGILQADKSSADYPVLITQGGADPLVPFRSTRDDVVSPLCKVSGEKAIFALFPFAGHNSQFDYGSVPMLISFVRNTVAGDSGYWPEKPPLPAQDAYFEQLAFGLLANCTAVPGP